MAKLISIYVALAQLDILEDDQGNQVKHKIGFVKTTGEYVGQLRVKERITKKKNNPAKFVNLDLPTLDKEQPRKKAKFSYKEKRVIPLWDQDKDEIMTLKIYSICQFNGARCVRPIIKDGAYIYPVLNEKGMLTYPDE